MHASGRTVRDRSSWVRHLEQFAGCVRVPRRPAELGPRPGSRLAFVPTADGYEIHPQAASIRDLKGSVSRPDRPVSVEEMNEAIAAAATADAP